MKKTTLSLAAIGSLSILAVMPMQADVIITEVDPSGSASNNNGFNNGYNQDWFELTNTGTSAVSISGWKMDDNHNSFGSGAAMSLLSGGTTIAAGQSVVFVESDGVSNVAALDSAFEQSWFGSNVPTGFTIGNYSGGNAPGLSQSGDSVNVYNSAGVLQAGVTFGSAGEGVTFDNSVAQKTSTSGTGSSDPTISTLSANGINGAFTSPEGHEIGSPGSIGATAAPEPSSFALGAIAASVLGFFAWRRRAVRA